jgi:hypothetical protein
VDVPVFLALQDGVISRAQVLAAGGDDRLIVRRLRRREWARVHPGVYVNHTGPLTWNQRAWAAVLLTAPAALGGRSALRAHGVRGHESHEDVRVVVAHHRRLARHPGIRIDRTRDFDRAVQPHLCPPRMRLEHALIRVASEARTDDQAVGVLSDGCQSRRTTVARLGEELLVSPKLPRRRLLLEILQDVGDGAMSALERRYLRDVERAHGLAAGQRQRREHTSRGSVQRDVEYADEAMLLELDGRLGHDPAEGRWRDLDRDLEAATTGRLTLRVGWGQVLQPCRLASTLALVLAARGWTGTPRPRRPGCPVGAPAR